MSGFNVATFSTIKIAGTELEKQQMSFCVSSVILIRSVFNLSFKNLD